ncbi:TrbI/VirB10 family protein [uncultured Treponema sp.]|uniref:TrbI/VirB10 family protein n=1 Tax=uncultured Treponema sp. TaxID=162155 RepID=UPI0025925C30|nr:TrbI/VirB10 family protein [uncultured Treponema sp.]
MNDEEENTGSIFDAIDAAQANSDEELNGFSLQNSELSNVGEIEVEDSLQDNEQPVFSDDLNSEPDFSADNVKPFENSQSEPEGESESHAEGQGETFSTVIKNEDEIKPFDSQKMSALDAMDRNGNKKPPVLNKQFILYCIIGVFAFLAIFALFIFPEITKKREKNKSTKPVATENVVTDYSMLVDEKEYSNNITSGEGPKNQPDINSKSKTNDEIIDNLPPVNDKYTYKEQPQQNVYYGGGTASTYEVPDTRTDALQAKAINGIKGISSTQKNYLTPDGVSTSYNNTAAAQTTSGNGTSSNPYSKFGVPDQASYTNQLLSQYASNNNSYAQQNDQSGKNTFYNQNKGAVSGQWLPLNSIWQGTIFDATLTSDICTDLPGECTAVITKNIYSSQDGRYLLIPQNSKLLGSYNSSISYSQSRVQVGWHTLIRPDGYMVNLGNFNATDKKGASGLTGMINDHPWAYLKAIALMSAVNIVNSELQATAASSTNEYVQNVMANSQEVATTLGQKLIDRAMDVQPSIKIKSGTVINIVANTNLELPVLEPWEVTEPYHKTRK